MNEEQKTIARECLDAAEHDRMPFPRIVETLHDAGFEGYTIDFRRGTATYHTADDSLDVALPKRPAVAAAFDADRIRAAIAEAQTSAPGYTYGGFCRAVTAAGCAGYLVSFSGRRVLYFGRTAETHIEHFPA